MTSRRQKQRRQRLYHKSSSSSFKVIAVQDSSITTASNSKLLSFRKGSIINVLGGCNPNGTGKRPIARETKRLRTGFLDGDTPVHNRSDDKTWWYGHVVSRSSKVTKAVKVGMFPQRSVALTSVRNESREGKRSSLTLTSSFRCKLCNRMQSKKTSDPTSLLSKHPALLEFGIVGGPGCLFGKSDLCVSCIPKMMNVVQSMAKVVTAPSSTERESMAVLRRIARSQLAHEDVATSSSMMNVTSPIAPTAPLSLTLPLSSRPQGNPPPLSSPLSYRSKKDLDSEERVRLQQPVVVVDEEVEEKFSTELEVVDFEEMRPALVSMYNNAATTKEGHLYPKDIQNMVTALSEKYPDIMFVDCNDETANILVDSLDDDQNGSVEMEEFVSWLISGMSRSKEHRIKFSEQGEVYAMLTQFMESVMEVARKITNALEIVDFEEMRPALVSMYNNAATTKEGHLYPKDIQNMVTALSEKYPDIMFVDCNDETANILVDSLDDDQNGSVEMEEFVSWLISGMSRSKEHRIKFSEQGEVYAMLTQFMESVMEVARKITNALEIVEDTVLVVEEEEEEEEEAESVVVQEEEEKVVEEKEVAKEGEVAGEVVVAGEEVVVVDEEVLELYKREAAKAARQAKHMKMIQKKQGNEKQQEELW